MSEQLDADEYGTDPETFSQARIRRIFRRAQVQVPPPPPPPMLLSQPLQPMRHLREPHRGRFEVITFGVAILVMIGVCAGIVSLVLSWLGSFVR